MLMANVLTLLARAWAEKEFSQSSAQNKSAEEIEAEIARLTKQAERSIQTQIDHMKRRNVEPRQGIKFSKECLVIINLS